MPPYYTFNVQDSAYYLSFGVMLIVALTMSRLTSRIREQAEEARDRERRTAALYDLNRELAGAGSRQRLVEVAARHIGLAARGEATIVRVDDSSAVGEAPPWPTTGVLESWEARVAAMAAYESGEATGWSTGRGAESEAMAVPLRTATRGWASP